MAKPKSLKVSESIPSSKLRLLHLFAAFIGLILSTVILLYVNKLEKIGCECAENWRRKYIQVYAIIMITVAFIDIFAALSGNATAYKILNMMSPITFTVGILFAIFGIQYVHYLQKEKCACSEEIGRDVLYIVSIVDAIFFSLVAVMALGSWIRYSLA